MTWRTEKTDEGSDYVWDGVEMGIGVSPTKGNAAIQNANISTELGEVMASYGRTNQAPAAQSSQTLTPNGATNFTGPSSLQAGQWIRVSSSTVTSISAATSPSSITCNYLVVAGGGGGGAALSGGAGGGGAGAVRIGTSSFSVGSYAISVGAGGAGGSTFSGSSGTDSAIVTVVTATGGGGGGTGSSGTSPSSEFNGKNGGSGGGGGADGSTSGTAGTGTTGGNNGGTGFASGTGNNRAGGGGGGAGGTGSNAASATAGNGGAGTASSISGTSVTYGGGGGGGSPGSAGSGGSGGGGAGGDSAAGTAGTDGLGGGGGGASDSVGGFLAGGDGGNGVVVISYTTGSMFATGGVITFSGGNTIHTFSIPSGFTSDTYTAAFNVISIPTGGLYYVSYKSGTTFKLSSYYDPTGANALTHGTTGSITFSTVTTPNSAVAKATEKYTDATNTYYRYYILDVNGYVWVYDSYIYATYGTTWMLPDPTDYSSVKLTGIAVLNGWLMGVGIAYIFGKSTVNLGAMFTQLPNVYLNEPFATHRNYAIAASQGKMYYCDGNYIGELFPTTSLVTAIANIQSYAKYTAATTTGTISYLAGGSLPYSPDSTTTRIPVTFITDQYGTLPTAVTAGTVYYIRYNAQAGTFNAYTALTGGSQVDIATGASGNQYFNTFNPVSASTGVSGAAATVQWSGQRVNLPQNETAQCLVEVGNNVIIGCNGSTLYPWNQIDATPSDFIALPEANVRTMVNVNNMAYVFAGNKGNVYITNTSVASLVLKVPDYCAGVPGTPLTYIEPYFTWGDAAYLRGRIYFSILDQTATKAGNCGGIWSFIPTQNFYVGQDIGLALRLENQNSYGDYDGYATIIIPNEEQVATSPQYWAAWQDSYSTGTSTFGIDQTGTTPVTSYVVETDLLATGTVFSKDTFTQLEYKLTTPMTAGDSVQLYYRLNATSAWVSCGTVDEEANDRIAGVFPMAFQKTQWIQIRAVATTGGTISSSFVRLKQIRLR
jgi:hypothetical protein